MPFKYGHAPLLVDNEGTSDFGLVLEWLDGMHRETFEGRLSSRIRSKATPLDANLASHVVDEYTRLRKEAEKKPMVSAIAKEYHEALPYPPPKIDQHRKATYDKLIRALARSNSGAVTPCSPPRTNNCATTN